MNHDETKDLIRQINFNTVKTHTNNVYYHNRTIADKCIDIVTSTLFCEFQLQASNAMSDSNVAIFAATEKIIIDLFYNYKSVN